jgi:alpha/beta superfamily hydrolase
MSKVQSIFLEGPSGRLEGILKTRTDSQSRAVAVICHPHPLYQGTMHNKVVFAIASALFDMGCDVLRFNFRGVGMSLGSHDGGRGEIEDTLASVRFLRRQYPTSPCLIAGFSFGAWMALEAAQRDPALISVTAVAPPLKYINTAILAMPATPKLFVQGTTDDICNPRVLQELYPSIPEPKQLVWLEGAGHFFEQHFSGLKAAIVANRAFLGLL